MVLTTPLEKHRQANCFKNNIQLFLLAAKKLISLAWTERERMKNVLQTSEI
jgi:hypothetical protein